MSQLQILSSIKLLAGSLRKAFNKDKPHPPDTATWLASYEEEYNGLVGHDTLMYSPKWNIKLFVNVLDVLPYLR
jgi:hypothetical protein